MRVDNLVQQNWWRAAARAYSDWLDTPHLAPGAACALQHYAGRLVGVTVTVWADTGELMDLDRDRWWVRLDEHARTTGVSAPGLRTVGVVTPVELGLAIREHFALIVESDCAATGIADWLAWGCVAASCAGAFGFVYRHDGELDGGRIRDAGVHVLTLIEEAAGRQLIDWQVEGRELGHVRRTCCLIRLGRGHPTACSACPHVTKPRMRVQTCQE